MKDQNKIDFEALSKCELIDELMEKIVGGGKYKECGCECGTDSECSGLPTDSIPPRG